MTLDEAIAFLRETPGFYHVRADEGRAIAEAVSSLLARIPAMEAEIAELRKLIATPVEPPVHYAPYGKSENGTYHCGSTEGGYATQPWRVTCEGCKAASPGLWPPPAKPEPVRP